MRSDGIWCNLQMWLFLRATTGPEYSSPERAVLECLAHLVQVNSEKYKTLGTFFIYIKHLLLFISMNEEVHFVFFLTCVSSGCFCYHGCRCLACKCQELKQRRRRDPRSLTCLWLSRAYDNTYKRRLPDKLISEEVMIMFSASRYNVI